MLLRPSSSSLVVLLSLSAVAACASSEAGRAKTVAEENLTCNPTEMEAAVERQTPEVREWFVACDFTYTRVHCSDAGCAQAPPKPPCIGDLQCFVENPRTLEWELAPTPVERVAGSRAGTRASPH